MFTGIVETQATVQRVERVAQDAARLHLTAGTLVADLQRGGSLAVNGVCLTAVPADGSEGTDFTADVYTEAGMSWVHDNSMRTVLLRHFPALTPVLIKASNPFAPWPAT